MIKTLDSQLMILQLSFSSRMISIEKKTNMERLAGREAFEFGKHDFQVSCETSGGWGKKIYERL